MLNLDDTIRILIVDDDEDDFFITSELITAIDSNRFKINWLYNYKKALEHIKKNDYDIYFIDYFLGGKTGLELLKEAVKYNRDVPIIMLTGKGNQVIDREAMKSGASDYLVKSDLTTEKLERCIRYSLEKARTLKELRDNELKFRSIFEQSKDAIFLTDSSLNFITVNSATTQLLHYSTEELTNLSVYDIIADKNETLRLKSLILNNNKLNDIELEFITKETEQVSCIFSATKIQRDNSNYLQVIMHDITKLRKAEKSALMAEKLAATGRLTRTLGHEIRNPLTNIQLSAEHLNYSGILDSQQEYIQIIQRNIRRISDILNELLNTAKPAAEIILSKISLQEVLNEGLFAVTDRITLKNIQLKVHYPNEPICIEADKDKLKLAFINIFLNAVEAMEEEDGILEVEVYNDDDSICSVYITDNGNGINEENMQRLFEPYFTSKRNGLGLGLVTTHNILHAHKAQVEVDSEVNKGTTFTITFNKYITNIPPLVS